MEAEERIRQLEQQIEQERQQREREEQQREQERHQLQQQREQERHQLQQQLEQKDQQLEQQGRRLRQTTLTEYLRLCHEHLSKSISIETNRSLTTKGSTTNVKRKHRPDSLEPWGDYLKQHKETLDLLYSVYPSPQPQVFPSSHYVQTHGEEVAKKKLASETDVHVFMRETMERPMTNIKQHLQALAAVRDRFDLPQGFRFENHGNSSDGAASEDAQMSEAQTPQPSTPLQARNSDNSHDDPVTKPRPDQFCFYTKVEGVDKVALVAEFKPPHKLSLKELRSVLGSDRHETKLDPIVNGIKAPPLHEKDAREEYDTEEKVAAVITQTFSYMVRSETQYGYIATGEAFVFLHIKLEDDMKTAYYYLAEPNEADSDSDGNKQHINSNPIVSLHRTAITQLITFSLHALKSANENIHWREDILPKLKIWLRHDQAVLDQITPTPTTAGKSSVGYQPDQADSPTSPTELRASSRKRPRHGCGPDLPTTSQSRHDSPPPPSSSPPPRHLTRSTVAKNKPNQASRSEGDAASSSHRYQNHSYCTQTCLKELARGGPLDQNCPNVSKHCEKGCRGDKHPLSGEEFRALLEEQLRRSRGADFRSLGVQGARGALFKVTLRSHGYTIVAKGTVRACVRYLRHEAEVYRRLAAIQGKHVPVYLGSLDLDFQYYHRDGIRIVHMMFLSWGGERLNIKNLADTDMQTRTSDIVRAVKAIHEAGVVHRDMRMPNLLWSEEMKRVIVIDFERANLIKATRQALSSLSPNKKRKRTCETEQEEADKKSVLKVMKKDPEVKYRAELDLLAAEDMFTARHDFWQSFF